MITGIRLKFKLQTSKRSSGLLGSLNVLFVRGKKIVLCLAFLKSCCLRKSWIPPLEGLSLCKDIAENVCWEGRRLLVMNCQQLEFKCLQPSICHGCDMFHLFMNYAICMDDAQFSLTTPFLTTGSVAFSSNSCYLVYLTDVSTRFAYISSVTGSWLDALYSVRD